MSQNRRRDLSHSSHRNRRLYAWRHGRGCKGFDVPHDAFCLMQTERFACCRIPDFVLIIVLSGANQTQCNCICLSSQSDAAVTHQMQACVFASMFFHAVWFKTYVCQLGLAYHRSNPAWPVTVFVSIHFEPPVLSLLSLKRKIAANK